MKKLIKALLIIILAAVLAVTLLWGKEIATINTIQTVGPNQYLYTMDYLAGYDLDDLISKDIDSNAKLLEYVVSRIGKGIPIKMKSSQVADENGELATFACTSFQVRNAEGEGYLFGRNYDYFKNPSIVTKSKPKDGYASIAVTDMSHIGYGLDKLPEKFMSKVNCLAAIYAPVDGMNEKGLCMSIMALPKQAAQQETGKHKVGTTVIIRLILDRCATVQEALDLINTFDIRHDAAVGSGYHYMIADAQGDCAVVEFDPKDGWKTLVVRKPESDPCMLVTNHLLSPQYYTTEPDEAVGNPHSRSWWRYETAGAYLQEHDGTLTLQQAQECLAMVHWKDLVWENGTVEDTQYSNVYDQRELTLAMRPWNDYEITSFFKL